jgi:hypothetical protein
MSQSNPQTENPVVFGVLAEYANTADLLHAAEKVRDAGYKKFDVYSPFPIHGMDDAMGLKPSKLGWIVLGHALLGFFGAIALMVWTSSVDYPINISGKPYINAPAFIPVIFELTVLLSAFGAVFGMFFLNDMPKHNNPLFNSERFDRVTNDKMFVCIESSDILFDSDKTISFLKEIGATHTEIVHD